MRKFKTIPFDIEKVKAGARVVTRDDRPCTIISLNGLGFYSVLGFIDRKRRSFTREGRYLDLERDHPNDLFIIEEEEVKP